MCSKPVISFLVHILQAVRRIGIRKLVSVRYHYKCLVGNKPGKVVSFRETRTSHWLNWLGGGELISSYRKMDPDDRHVANSDR